MDIRSHIINRILNKPEFTQEYYTRNNETNFLPQQAKELALKTPYVKSQAKPVKETGVVPPQQLARTVGYKEQEKDLSNLSKKDFQALIAKYIGEKYKNLASEKEGEQLLKKINDLLRPYGIVNKLYNPLVLSAMYQKTLDSLSYINPPNVRKNQAELLVVNKVRDENIHQQMGRRIAPVSVPVVTGGPPAPPGTILPLSSGPSRTSVPGLDEIREAYDKIGKEYVDETIKKDEEPKYEMELTDILDRPLKKGYEKRKKSEEVIKEVSESIEELEKDVEVKEIEESSKTEEREQRAKEIEALQLLPEEKQELENQVESQKQREDQSKQIEQEYALQEVLAEKQKEDEMKEELKKHELLRPSDYSSLSKENVDYRDIMKLMQNNIPENILNIDNYKAYLFDKFVDGDITIDEVTIITNNEGIPLAVITPYKYMVTNVLLTDKQKNELDIILQSFNRPISRMEEEILEGEPQPIEHPLNKPIIRSITNKEFEEDIYKELGKHAFNPSKEKVYYYDEESDEEDIEKDIYEELGKHAFNPSKEKVYYYDEESDEDIPKSKKKEKKFHEAEDVLYDENGKPIEIFHEAEDVLYDKNGKPIEIFYDAKGEPMYYDAKGEPMYFDARDVLYDENGKKVDIFHEAETTLYDENGNPVEIFYDTDEVLYDKNGKKVEIFYDPEEVLHDKNGKPIKIYYDSEETFYGKNGKPIEVFYDSEEFLYDGHGNPVKVYYDAKTGSRIITRERHQLMKLSEPKETVKTEIIPHGTTKHKFKFNKDGHEYEVKDSIKHRYGNQIIPYVELIYKDGKLVAMKSDSINNNEIHEVNGKEIKFFKPKGVKYTFGDQEIIPDLLLTYDNRKERVEQKILEEGINLEPLPEEEMEKIVLESGVPLAPLSDEERIIVEEEVKEMKKEKKKISPQEKRDNEYQTIILESSLIPFRLYGIEGMRTSTFYDDLDKINRKIKQSINDIMQHGTTSNINENKRKINKQIKKYENLVTELNNNPKGRTGIAIPEEEIELIVDNLDNDVLRSKTYLANFINDINTYRKKYQTTGRGLDEKHFKNLRKAIGRLRIPEHEKKMKFAESYSIEKRMKDPKTKVSANRSLKKLSKKVKEESGGTNFSYALKPGKHDPAYMNKKVEAETVFPWFFNTALKYPKSMPQIKQTGRARAIRENPNIEKDMQMYLSSNSGATILNRNVMSDHNPKMRAEFNGIKQTHLKNTQIPLYQLI